jgi:hypothetical protein
VLGGSCLLPGTFGFGSSINHAQMSPQFQTISPLNLFFKKFGFDSGSSFGSSSGSSSRTKLMFQF